MTALSSKPGYLCLDLVRYIRANRLDGSRFKIMDIGEILPVHPLE